MWNWNRFKIDIKIEMGEKHNCVRIHVKLLWSTSVVNAESTKYFLEVEVIIITNDRQKYFCDEH